MDRFVRAQLILALATLACGLGTPAGATPTTESIAPAPPTGTAEAPLPTAPTATATIEGPAEAIWIQAPGNGSRLVGHVHVQGEADPTFEQTLVVQVVALDAEPFDVLAQEPVTIGADAGLRGPFDVDLAFDLGGAAERPGAVNVFTTSARDGGITHLASIHVTLAAAGSETLMAGESAQERIAVLVPAAGDSLGGGVAHIEGLGWASFEQTLLVEILDTAGTVVGTSPVILTAPDVGLPGPFAVDVPYSLTSAGPGRVVVRDISPAFGQTLHQTTVDVHLAP